MLGRQGTAGVIVLLLVLACAPAASAKKAFDPGSATISRCGGDSLTVAAFVRGSKKARGARLQLKFDIVPMFGDPRRTPWVDIGATSKASRSQLFKGLSANAWIGAVRYRFMKGSKVVEQGSLRSRSGKAGKARGRGVCTLPIGLIPIDALAPFVLANPSQDDGIWHRAPVTVTFTAVDDLSGVASVDYAVNGAPGSGRSLTISQDGIFSIDYSARDVAGNRSATLSTGAHVDASPPTAPTVTLPTGTTSDNSPTIGWTASSDAASGVQGYVVVIRDSGGNVVTAIPVGAGATSTSAPKLNNGGYTAQVFAYDGAQPQPFVTASGVQGFTVNNVTYSNDLSTCANFSNASRWSCTAGATGDEHTTNAPRCSDATPYPTTSDPVSDDGVAGDPMRLNFTYDFQPNQGGDTASVEVLRASDSAVLGGITPLTSASSGSSSVPYPSPGAAQVKLRFTHTLAGGGAPDVLCPTPSGPNSFAVDNLSILRKP